MGLVSFTQHFVSELSMLFYGVVFLSLAAGWSIMREFYTAFVHLPLTGVWVTLFFAVTRHWVPSHVFLNTIAQWIQCTPLRFRWVPRRGIAGSSGVGLLYFSRYYKKIFRSGFSKLYSTCSVWKFQLLWICPNAYVVWFSYFNYSDDCAPGNLMVKVNIH